MAMLEKGWRAFKLLVYAAGALFVLLLALGFYLAKDPPRPARSVATAIPPTAPSATAIPPTAPSAPPASSNVPAPKLSALVAQLDRNERDPTFTFKLLLDGLKQVDEGEARQVAAWLEPRKLRGELPYLYFLGAYYGKQADDARKVAGMEHLLKGAIVYRVDAAKCGDSTANQAVPILEGAIGSAEARERLKQDAALRARLVASALDYELATGDRPLPKWVCAHGLRAGSPTPDAATFQAHREAVRARYVAISAAPQQQSGTSR